MDCCNINGLNKIFNKSKAAKEAKGYLSKGLGRRATMVLEFLSDQNVSGASILDIGCGVGSLHIELLKQGAGSATGVEVSQSYVEAATSLSGSLGFQDATQYHMGDFVDLEADIPPADMVVLDRVVCCYPDMKGLIECSTRHAQSLYVLTYPRRTWWMRIGARALNIGLAATRREFRFFLHHPKEIWATIEAAGFSLIQSGKQGPWEVASYRRRSSDTTSPASPRQI